MLKNSEIFRIRVYYVVEHHGTCTKYPWPPITNKLKYHSYGANVQIAMKYSILAIFKFSNLKERKFEREKLGLDKLHFTNCAQI